ncbi:I78 family peptidase inhibitor [Novosphingobium sp. KCTC 2891]|uniref:I78 family peptidase inhibitor n=1 Tax=Novosphingobium sp. KCTC 2891 TaxID=2989730 RepID=UPI0022223933|nr:I78 family peptidase inhibitor [Novosphingobium sp. KCTC 2891]MCW1383878.1 I78 family peptidase inhibitor [Novosphingobium sp. KCTC 2891]
MHKTILLLSLAAATAACAQTPAPAVSAPSPVPQETCNRDAGQAFLGRTASAELGAQILAATGARNLRWVAPGMAVTMDFRGDRVTVGYDEKMSITSIACG